MSERPKVGLAVYIRKHDTVLFGQRLSEHGKGSWCPPGGHLEYGEDFISCARREVAEECGLDVTTPKLVCVTNDLFPSGKHYVTLNMVADYITGTPAVLEPDKINAWGWFRWSELPSPLFFSPQQAITQGFNPFAKTGELQPC